MAGNGYFAENVYQAKSTETWDDLTNNWDTYTSWNYSPSLPLEFTSNVIDFGRKDIVNYYTALNVTGGSATTTVSYGDSVDSAGGAIDSPSTVTVNPGDNPSAVKARYFQIKISIGASDSAGQEDPVTIQSFDIDLNATTVQVNEDSIVSSTLSGSTGERQLSAPDVLSSVKTAVLTAHLNEPRYVASSYVVDPGDSADGVYVATGEPVVPHIVLDKSSTPIVLHIYDLNTFGPTKVDCTFDAVLTGLPRMLAAPDGSIQQG